MSNNSSGYFGGGLVHDGSGTINDSTFVNNSSPRGGGILIYYGTLSVVNSTFSGNSATNYGGAIGNRNGNVTLRHLTITGNSAPTGAGISSKSNADTTRTILTSSIVAGNDTDADSGKDVQITGDGPTNTFQSNGYNVIGTVGTTAVINGTGDVTHVTDPLLIPLADNGCVTQHTTTSGLACVQTYGLQAASMAVDLAAGSNTATDQRGAERPQGEAPDAGAYENDCNVATVLRVATMGNDVDGSSWANAYTSLSQALEVARNCAKVEEIWVAAGVYTPGNSIEDSFYLVPDVELYGGFSGTETVRTDRDWEANPTILSGDIDGDDTTSNGVVTDVNNINGDNSYHVVAATGLGTTGTAATTVIDGFTITAGQADGEDESNTSFGGGFFSVVSGAGTEYSPIFRNVIFFGNMAKTVGGAMSMSALFGGTTHPMLTNVVFRNNYSMDGGAALYNSAVLNGVNELTLANVLFADNIALSFGGALAVVEGQGATNNTTITNGTFFGNDSEKGGAISTDGATPILYNSIVWGNGSTLEEVLFSLHNDPITMVNSLVQWSGGSNSWAGGILTDGGNNIDVDPQFVDADANNLRLSVGSPAINAGDNSYVSATTDLDGNLRIQGSAVDMGAYELSETTAVPPTVNITTSLLTHSNDVPSCLYNLDHSLLPYSDFSELIADMGTAPYDMSGDLGGVPNYYQVEMDCGAGGTAVSNTVGEFSFVIVPGD